MRVTKRDGSLEDLQFDKVTTRLRSLCNDPNIGEPLQIDSDSVAKDVISKIYDGVTTSELDEEAARIAVSISEHPDFAKLASRILISNLHKSTPKTFKEAMHTLLNNKDVDGNHSPAIRQDFWDLVEKYGDQIETFIDYTRDYSFDFFAIKTLEKGYLLKQHLGNNNFKVVERPQHMYMRVAVEVFKDNLELVKRCYEELSLGKLSVATPTLFNAGTPLPQMSSCFLLDMEDSIDGIYKSFADIAKISKVAGGIGINISSIRGKNSLIRKTNGRSDGIVPLARVMNATSTYVNQTGKRNGSIAMYIEPWHSDIFEFIELKRNQGSEYQRARDLFYALWVPDLFMKKVQADDDWYLLCPDQCRGLVDAFGDKFDELYESYVAQGKYRKKVKAQELWRKILDSQIETGGPYVLFKDAVNAKNDQAHLGTIKNSNLCAEIVLYSNTDEYAVCNLCSIALPKFVVRDDSTGQAYFDFESLHKLAGFSTRVLDSVIESNFYPTPETKRSNQAHRPIGIGVQGLHDVYMMLRLPFESSEALELNRRIFETIYHGSMESSMEMAKDFGAYSSFPGSPASQGILQPDLWIAKEKLDPDSVFTPKSLGGYDWNTLREDIKRHGLRHSLVTAVMPTASTAQILGNFEAIEPMDSNIFKRRVLSGEFLVINKHLMADLVKLGLWNKNFKDQLILSGGSIQSFDDIPGDLKELYKTVWEIDQKAIIKQAVARGSFVSHTQSMNLFLQSPSHNKISNLLFTAWKKGLKTGLYYLRSQPAFVPSKFTVDPALEKLKRNLSKLDVPSSPAPTVGSDAGSEMDGAVCAWRPGDPGSCEACSA